MNLSTFQISERATLEEALSCIEENKHGIIFVTAGEGQIIGLATDGDIRRALLEGKTLASPIIDSANPEFVWADAATKREVLLKQLDHCIRVIPLLDEHRRLTSIVSRNHLPLKAEERVYARARSPVRVSFGGGGSDLTHYFMDQAGAVINTTLTLYSHATLREREDSKVIISSQDLGGKLEAPDLQTALCQESPFRLIQAVLKVVRPQHGFELYLNSDFPMKSGLGGSAVVAAAVLGCFNQFRRDQWDSHELAELAFQAERLYLGVAGGWQDQYATVFGGFNFMEFQTEQNIVHPLRIHPDTLVELEESLILCDTLTTHDSGTIHDDQRQQMQQAEIQKLVKANVDLTYQMRNHLLRGRLFQFGLSLHEAWMLKRQFSKQISNSRLDAIYQKASESGAIGGKLMGAGGGGFFLFYAAPFRRHELVEALQAEGLYIRPFRFDHEGLRTWVVRERRNNCK